MQEYIRCCCLIVLYDLIELVVVECSSSEEYGVTVRLEFAIRNSYHSSVCIIYIVHDYIIASILCRIHSGACKKLSGSRAQKPVMVLPSGPSKRKRETRGITGNNITTQASHVGAHTLLKLPIRQSWYCARPSIVDPAISLGCMIVLCTL
jgi:hypothetical protein